MWGLTIVPIDCSLSNHTCTTARSASFIASSCRGDGVCAKCRIEITDGRKNVSAENSLELYLRERFGFEKAVRISCQTKVLGDITITTSYW